MKCLQPLLARPEQGHGSEQLPVPNRSLGAERALLGKQGAQHPLQLRCVERFGGWAHSAADAKRIRVSNALTQQPRHPRPRPHRTRDTQTGEAAARARRWRRCRPRRGAPYRTH